MRRPTASINDRIYASRIPDSDPTRTKVVVLELVDVVTVGCRLLTVKRLDRENIERGGASVVAKGVDILTLVARSYSDRKLLGLGKKSSIARKVVKIVIRHYRIDFVIEIIVPDRSLRRASLVHHTGKAHGVVEWMSEAQRVTELVNENIVAVPA